MSGARLIVEALPEPGGVCRIRGEESAHARARRLAPGDAVVLLDGSGREAHGRVSRTERGTLEIVVDSLRAARAEAGRGLALSIAAIKAERLAWVAEKATELGVERLTLLVSERTQPFRARGSLLPRLERVVREAAKQSERAFWPSIEGPIPLNEALRREDAPHRFLLDPRGESFPASVAGATALLVGPEGGWTAGELDAALAAGWTAVSLAAGKLRAETAAVAALALARAAMARGSES